MAFLFVPFGLSLRAYSSWNYFGLEQWLRAFTFSSLAAIKTKHRNSQGVVLYNPILLLNHTNCDKALPVGWISIRYIIQIWSYCVHTITWTFLDLKYESLHRCFRFHSDQITNTLWIDLFTGTCKNICGTPITTSHNVKEHTKDVLQSKGFTNAVLRQGIHYCNFYGRTRLYSLSKLQQLHRLHTEYRLDQFSPSLSKFTLWHRLLIPANAPFIYPCGNDREHSGNF